MGERNNYAKLRYDNDTTWKPNISQRDLADEIGIAFSTISKLEREGCDTATVSTVKAYRNYFLEKRNEDICYEYFMEETATKHKKYYELGKLFPFDDSFYKNLSQLLELDSGNHLIELMLSALLSNPHELFNALVTIYNSLYKINDIRQNKELSATEKTSMLKIQEYVFSQTTIEYLENILMPVLHSAFEETNDFKAEEALITQQELDELNSGDTVSPVSAIVNIVEVKQIEK